MSDFYSPVLHLVHLDIDATSVLNDELIQRLSSACDEVEDTTTPAVLLLHLRGADTLPAEVSWPGPASLDVVGRWEKAMRRFERLEGVSLACIEHACTAGMLDVLLAVDRRIAVPGASIRMHSSGEATWPSMAMRRMSTRLSIDAARAVFLFDRQLDCARMAQLGVVDQVSEDSRATISGWLASLADVDVQALPGRRLLLLEGAAHSYEQAVGQHLAACDMELRRRQRRVAPQQAPTEHPQGACVRMASA